MGSHSVTCHPAEVTFPPLPQPKLVLDPRYWSADGRRSAASLTAIGGGGAYRLAAPGAITYLQYDEHHPALFGVFANLAPFYNTLNLLTYLLKLRYF